jgi:uncharacterized membrane protein (DUF4010 family)
MLMLSSNAGLCAALTSAMLTVIVVPASPLDPCTPLVFTLTVQVSLVYELVVLVIATAVALALVDL